MADTYVAYKKREGICDSFCNGCVFKGYANATLYVCEYFFQTGVQRPCPAGTGCTVKESGQKKKRWKHESDRTWKNKKKKENKSCDGPAYAAVRSLKRKIRGRCTAQTSARTRWRKRNFICGKSQR